VLMARDQSAKSEQFCSFLHRLRRSNGHADVACWPILLQKSKVVPPRIFRENTKRETTTDSHTLNRVAEVSGEFNARGSSPSRLYNKDAPTVRRIFHHLRKATFATLSAHRVTFLPRENSVAFDQQRT
jgi:hypothetical protein